MANPGLSDEKCIEAIALVEKHGTVTRAAEAAGMSRETLSSRYRTALRRKVQPKAVEVEELPPPDLPFDQRLETMKERNRLRIAHARAQAWQAVKVPVEGPYGICWFGDPHMDDPFCDLDAIERHAGICARTPALYGANGGDSINNWVGRLERIYAEQSATASEGWELVEWLLKDLGVNWLLWILGNHDTWNYGKRIFEGLNCNRVLMRDWDAKLRLLSPCGGEARIWARHDFKGTSIYNELHALKRAAMMDEEADVYVAFHRHTFGTAQGELAGGRRYCLVRAKGYKESDDYAIKNQFHEQRLGQSVVTIVEPRHGAQPIIHAYEDVERGADFLTFLRKKAGH